MEEVEVEGKSSWVAKCTDIIIRETDKVRLLFRPELVRNSVDPAACLHGRFLYQKKSAKDEWEDFDARSLSTIRNGEQFQLNMDASELHPFLKQVGALYRQYQKKGIPQGKVTLVQVAEPLAKLLELSEADFNRFLSDHPGDAVKTLKRVICWLSQNPSAAQRFAEDDQLPELNALVNLANLRALLEVWRENAENDNEEFWQQTFATHNFVLSQLFAYPVVIIEQKAYVGGKQCDNQHGNVADFLGRAPSTGGAVIIEIKTPGKPLLGSIYRQVFPPSRDVSGALSQVLQYRENLMLEMFAVARNLPVQLTPCEPRCVVIVGHAGRELVDEDKRRAFERFRERLTGVVLITFDEVFARVESMISLLETQDDCPL